MPVNGQKSMAQQSNGQAKEKVIEELPNDDTTVEHKLGPEKICPKGQHFFRYVRSDSAECKYCPMGFYMTPGSDIIDGHVYINGELLI